MKVIHLLNSLMPSGMEAMLVSAAKEWHELGVESLVVCQGNHHPYRSAIEGAGFPVRIIEPIRSVKGARQFHEIVRQVQPDVVNIHTEGAFVFSVLATRIASKRTAIVRTVHSVFSPVGKAWLSRKVQSSIADRFVDTFIAPSDAVAANELRWHRATTTIFNWVDSRFLEVKSRRFPGAGLRILVGNCSTVKNHELAVRAVLAEGSSLAHVGDDSNCSQEERELLEQLNVRGKLVHCGQADPLPFLIEGNTFLLPSLVEGFSVALAEAIAVGIPVLANDIPGISWARGMPGVELTEPDLNKWLRALSFEDGEPYFPNEMQSSIDLSPSRGALQYLSVFRNASLKRRKTGSVR